MTFFSFSFSPKLKKKSPSELGWGRKKTSRELTSVGGWGGGCNRLYRWRSGRLVPLRGQFVQAQTSALPLPSDGHRASVVSPPPLPLALPPSLPVIFLSRASGERSFLCRLRHGQSRWLDVTRAHAQLWCVWCAVDWIDIWHEHWTECCPFSWC